VLAFGDKYGGRAMSIGRGLATILTAAVVAIAAEPSLAKTYSANSGVLTPLGPFGRFDGQNCQDFGKMKYSLTQPQNGTLTGVFQEGKFNRGICKGKRAVALVVYYRSKPGFKGTDRGGISYFAPRFVGEAETSISDTIIVTVK
jgi:hypothetical protein